MNTELAIKNFRVFDNRKGATFRLAPITILTGCNSAGKSSVVKSMLLLRDFFGQLKTQSFSDSKLNFGNKLAKLGRFDTVLNNGSASDSKITFSYTIYSDLVREQINVTLTFVADENDVLNDGWLKDIHIKKAKTGRTLMSAKIDGGIMVVDKIDLNSIKKDFLRYVLIDVIKYYLWNCPYDIIENDDKVVVSTPDKEEIIIAEMYKVLAALISSQDEFDAVVKQVEVFRHYGYPNDYRKSKYDRQLIMEACKSGSLFYMPLFEYTKNVDKSAVLDVVVKKCGLILTEPEKAMDYYFSGKYKEESALIEKEYDIYRRSECIYGKLESLLADFKASKYNTLFEYFANKEKEGLVFTEEKIDLHHHGDIRPRVIRMSQVKNLTDIKCNDAPTFDGNLFSVSRILMDVSRINDENYEKTHCSIDRSPRWPGEVVSSTLYLQLQEFFENVIDEVLAPTQFCNFEYVGDAGINIQRLYTGERGDDVGELTFRYLNACRKRHNSINKYQRDAREGIKYLNCDIDTEFTPGDFINKWVKRFELGDHVSFNQTADGLGVVVKLHKTAKDKEGRLLADEGFGITKLICTLINVELAILAKQPSESVTLALEEPENHLHPRFQSLLAEMFADAYKNYNVHFIIETHSEYAVRKLQTLVASKELTAAEVSLQYVYNADSDKRPKGEPHVKNISFREDGSLTEPFGSGFFDEADNLAMDLLRIKVYKN